MAFIAAAPQSNILFTRTPSACRTKCRAPRAAAIFGKGTFANIPTLHRRPPDCTESCVVRAALASGVGVSSVPETGAAVAAAVSSARAALGPGAQATFAVVSATPDRDLDEVARLFHEELEGVPSVGASSCNSVLTVEGSVTSGISVLLLAASDGCFADASAVAENDTPEAAYVAGRDAAASIKAAATARGGPKAVYMAASPGQEEHILRAIRDVLGSTVPVVGGSAADNDVTGSWAVFHSGAALRSGVALFAVAGDVSAGAAMSTPYVETSQSASVTAADGRRVLQLDGKPAADVLYSFVGDTIESEYKNGGMIIRQTSTVPMSLRRSLHNGTIDRVSAHAAFIHQPEGSVSFFVEAKVGDTLTVMQNCDGRSAAGAAGAAIRSAFEAAKANGGLKDPTCCMLVYCAGLAIAVGDALDGNMTDDFAAVASRSAIGLTAYGEQGPLLSAAGEEPRNHHCNLAVSMLVME
jgi:hypothetical protein